MLVSSIRKVKHARFLARGTSCSFSLAIPSDLQPQDASKPTPSNPDSLPREKPTMPPSFFSGNIDPKAYFLSQKEYDLADILTMDNAPPGKVWTKYMALYEFVLTQMPPPSLLPTSFASTSSAQASLIPLITLQHVLRKCVPPTSQLTAATRRRREHSSVAPMPHLYEVRLQSVIRHIRIFGFKPALEDYHFVLEQFAAVGHHVGVKGVYKEIIRNGYTPTPRTYGLVLQTCAEKLRLRVPFNFQESVLRETTDLCTELLDEMVTRGIPWTSVNSDLFLRILNYTTTGEEAFVKGLQMIYGLDLENPDRMPLSFLTRIQNPPADLELEGNLLQQPFSTAALNTTIDFLGKRGKVSQMITAFEVTTKPISVVLSDDSTKVDISSKPLELDDDDDDPSFYQFGNEKTVWHPPQAIPNTQTFIFLIRHLAKAKNHALVRHYLVQAMDLDRQQDSKVKADLAAWAERERVRQKASSLGQEASSLEQETESLEQEASSLEQEPKDLDPQSAIIPVRIAVNSRMLLPPYGYANRQSIVELVRWLNRHIDKVVKWKTKDLKFYKQFEALWAKSSQQDDHQRIPDDTSLPDTIPLPKPRKATRRLFKPFSLSTHIETLTKDIADFDRLNEIVEEGKARMSQRTKEKLGRRVWAGKDIWLNSTADGSSDPLSDPGIIEVKPSGRVVISPEKWKEIVGWKTSRWNEKTARGRAKTRAEKRKKQGDDARAAYKANKTPTLTLPPTPA